MRKLKCYLVDLDINGEGVKGFRRFRKKEDAALYALNRNGVMYREYSNGDLCQIIRKAEHDRPR